VKGGAANKNTGNTMPAQIYCLVFGNRTKGFEGLIMRQPKSEDKGWHNKTGWVSKIKKAS